MGELLSYQVFTSYFHVKNKQTNKQLLFTFPKCISDVKQICYSILHNLRLMFKEFRFQNRKAKLSDLFCCVCDHLSENHLFQAYTKLEFVLGFKEFSPHIPVCLSFFASFGQTFTSFFYQFFYQFGFMIVSFVFLKHMFVKTASFSTLLFN